MSTSYIDRYMEETMEIVNTIDRNEIAKGVEILKKLRDDGGRLFILGVGGSAANASHAVNDFRKIGKILLKRDIVLIFLMILFIVTLSLFIYRNGFF